MKEIILASNSPRRKELLKKTGVKYRVISKNVKEKYSKNYSKEIVEYNSYTKASAAAEDFCGKNAVIIGADTVVVLDNMCLVKPQNIFEAIFMLKKLSGKTHTVFTSHTFIDTREKIETTKISETKVTFRKLNLIEIIRYIITKNPLDKAGSYGIQDFLSENNVTNPPKNSFISKIEGNFNNVVGLDTDIVFEMLDNLQCL